MKKKSDNTVFIKLEKSFKYDRNEIRRICSLYGPIAFEAIDNIIELRKGFITFYKHTDALKCVNSSGTNDMHIDFANATIHRNAVLVKFKNSSESNITIYMEEEFGKIIGTDRTDYLEELILYFDDMRSAEKAIDRKIFKLANIIEIQICEIRKKKKEQKKRERSYSYSDDEDIIIKQAKKIKELKKTIKDLKKNKF